LIRIKITANLPPAVKTIKDGFCATNLQILIFGIGTEIVQI